MCSSRRLLVVVGIGIMVGVKLLVCGTLVGPCVSMTVCRFLFTSDLALIGVMTAPCPDVTGLDTLW